MRGDNEQQAGMYSYLSPEQRVPVDHPLRPMRKMTDEIFAATATALRWQIAFTNIYATEARQRLSLSGYVSGSASLRNLRSGELSASVSHPWRRFNFTENSMQPRERRGELCILRK